MEQTDHQLLFVLMYSKHLWKKLEQPDKALNVLRTEFLKQKDSVHLLLAYQKVLREVGKTDEAVRVLEEAVADEELREEDKAWMQLV